MLSVLLVSVVLAHPAEPLLTALPAPPALLVACSSLEEVASILPAGMGGSSPVEAMLRNPAMASSGVDLGAPLVIAMGSDQRMNHVGVQLPLTDAAAFSASTLLAEASEDDVHWAISDDTALLFASTVREDEGDALVARLGISRMLDGLDLDAPGCTIAMDLSGQSAAMPIPMMSDLGMTLHLDFANLDHAVMRGYGIPLPETAVAALRGKPPRQRAIGTGTWSPMMVVRMNVDLNALLESAAKEGGDLSNSPAGPLAKQLWDEGLRFAPGAEVAVLSGGGPADLRVVVVVPMKRPLRAKRLLREVEEQFLAEGREAIRDGELLRVALPDARAVWLGAKGRSVVVGLNPDDVGEVLRGEGEPWVSEPFRALAEEPGWFLQADYSSEGLQKLIDRDLPLGLSEAAIVIRMPEAGVIELDMLATGMGDAIRAAILQGMTDGQEADAPPEQAPESSEAAAILSLIASRENEAKANNGAFVPYTGGPRAIESLDGMPQPWEGIPALGIDPMHTACRYEISLGPDSFTARAFCDEDDDGAVAIRVVGASGIPERVTPEGVR